MEFRNPDTPLTVKQSARRKQVYRQISAEPRTFDMGSWEWHQRLWERAVGEPCRTTRCLGGWAQFYAKGYVDTDAVVQDAIDALGLTWDEYRESPVRDLKISGLFYLPDSVALDRMKALAEAEPGE